MRRRRDVEGQNVSEILRMLSEGGQRDGKGENIKGNALVPDFAQNLTLAYS